MNIRLRFALLFTAFVAFILSFAGFSIYYLYSNFRLQEFHTRINHETEYRYHLYLDTTKNTNNYNKSINLNLIALSDFSMVIFDSSYKPIYQYPSSQSIDPSLYTKIKKLKKTEPYNFKEQDKDASLVYFSNTKHYVYASAFDVYGLRKISKIRLILWGVFFGGFAIALFIAFFFVKEALKPLKQLSNQMIETKDIYQAKPVIVKNTNDELSQIATSYNAMIEHLKQMFDYQKSFVHNASHELRTPLALMHSEIETALKNNLDSDELKLVLASLKQEQQNILAFTNALLLLSKYERSSFKSWEHFRIDLFLNECIAEAKLELTDATINFDFGNIRNEDDLYLHANRPLLTLAIKNLIKNGYLYAADKKVIIRLFYNNETVEITVINDGPEVPIENRDKLFNPFFRAHNIDTNTSFGLGLSIVKRIVEVHGGKIIYSTYGHNRNCFIITLQKQKPVE